MSSCRVCMQKSKFLQQMKYICCTPDITFQEAFKVCTGLVVRSKEELCKICAEQLKKCYKFICQARDAHEKLCLAQEQHDGSTRKREKNKCLKELDGDGNLILAYEEADLEIANSNTVPTELSMSINETDPLEKSENEDDESALNYNELVSNVANSGDDDEEDNKPLNEILHQVKIAQSLPNAKISNEESTVLCEEKEKAAAGLQQLSSASENDDKEYEFNTSPTETVTDLAVSAEAQIFPQGRYKCKICSKNYFTTIGLKAHLEVHLPKSVTLKKKRVRGPNKKKKKPIEKEQTNVVQETESSVLKKDAEIEAEQKTETIQGTESKEEHEIDLEQKKTRKPRKEKLPKPKKMFPCHVCGKHMISASKLRYHMVMHTGEKDYLCTMCPKAYSTIYALKHHLRTHTGERPYECKFCGDKFLRPTTLKSHMRRHTGERPYGCDICGKRFIQHSSMTTHMKLNHMAKTIPCPHCDKKYARQTDLNTHLLSHTGNKPFSCQLCPSRFIRQANLNKHMNQQHSSTKTSETKSTKAKRASNSKATIKMSTVRGNIIAGQTEASAVLLTSSSKTNISTANNLAAISNIDNNTGIPVENSSATILSATNPPLLLVSNNQQSLQNASTLTAAFTNSTVATTAFAANIDNCEMLSISHTKAMQTNVHNAQLAVGNHMHQHQQQPLYIDSSVRFAPQGDNVEDLNRWNWPNQS